MRLAELKRPFICTVIAESTCGETIAEIDEVEETIGTDAFEVNLAPLELESLGDVFSCTNLPCIATNRRAEFMKVYGYSSLTPINDAQRAARLLKALDQGARAIDFELDLFDRSRGPKKKEITRNAEAIKQQKALVKRVKSSGGEVVVSSHSQLRISRGQVTDLAQAIQSRGADFAKIVTTTFDYKDIIELQETARMLSSRLSIPFNLMNIGEYAVLGRLLSTLCGSSWVYCRTESEHSYKGQPLTSEAKDFRQKYFATFKS